MFLDISYCICIIRNGHSFSLWNGFYVYSTRAMAQ